MKQAQLFFLLTLFFFGEISWSFDTSEFYDCDELFCMEKDGSYLETPIDGMAPSIGFKIDKEKTGIQNVNDIKFELPLGKSTHGQTGRDAGTRFTSANISDDSADNNDLGVTETETNPGDSSQASHWSAGSRGGNAFQQSGGSQGFSGLGSGGSSQVSASSLKGSLPGSGQVGDIRSGGGAAHHSSSLNPALLNRRNRGIPGGVGSQKKGSSPKMAHAGRGGSFPGRASSPGRESQSTGKKRGFLSKLANKLGLGRYFGGGGGRNFRGSYGRKKYNFRRNENIKKTQAGRLKSPKDIIRESFNKNFRQRGLANSLEFEGSRTSLFQKICEHYDNYAKSQNIPDNRKHCPRDDFR